MEHVVFRSELVDALSWLIESNQIGDDGQDPPINASTVAGAIEELAQRIQDSDGRAYVEYILSFFEDTKGEE